MAKVLPLKFYNRKTLIVAKNLLGKFLVRQYRGRKISAMITEVEAYDGRKDKASHAYRGITKRNKVMFGPAGRWYVYLIYGMYWLINIITGPENYPAGVLIRGVEGASGPGRVGKKFHVDGKLTGKPAVKKSGMWIEDRGIKISKSQIKATPRIGVDYAGPVWSKKHYRFLLKHK